MMFGSKVGPGTVIYTPPPQSILDVTRILNRVCKRISSLLILPDTIKSLINPSKRNFVMVVTLHFSESRIIYVCIMYTCFMF